MGTDRGLLRVLVVGAMRCWDGVFPGYRHETILNSCTPTARRRSLMCHYQSVGGTFWELLLYEAYSSGTYVGPKCPISTILLVL